MSLAVILLPSVFLLKFWVVAKGPISPVTSQIRSWHVQRNMHAVGMCSVASVMSDSLRPHELQFSRLLGPRDPPGKNSGVGGCAFLQGIFLTQGLKPSLLFLQVSGIGKQVGSLPLVPPSKPNMITQKLIIQEAPFPSFAVYFPCDFRVIFANFCSSFFILLLVPQNFYFKKLFGPSLYNLREVEYFIVLRKKVVRDDVGDLCRGQVMKGFVCHVKEF